MFVQSSTIQPFSNLLVTKLTLYLLIIVLGLIKVVDWSAQCLHPTFRKFFKNGEYVLGLLAKLKEKGEEVFSRVNLRLTESAYGMALLRNLVMT